MEIEHYNAATDILTSIEVAKVINESIDVAIDADLHLLLQVPKYQLRFYPDGVLCLDDGSDDAKYIHLPVTTKVLVNDFLRNLKFAMETKKSDLQTAFDNL